MESKLFKSMHTNIHLMWNVISIHLDEGLILLFKSVKEYLLCLSMKVKFF